MEIISRSPKETISLGKKIARLLKKGDIVLLFGEFGSGKTTFVKGLAAGLGVKKETVNSPSFVLVKEFKGRLRLFHFDLYRLNKLQEIF
jgi:Predicted ATPase or kinase